MSRRGPHEDRSPARDELGHGVRPRERRDRASLSQLRRAATRRLLLELRAARRSSASIASRAARRSVRGILGLGWETGGDAAAPRDTSRAAHRRFPRRQAGALHHAAASLSEREPRLLSALSGRAFVDCPRRVGEGRRRRERQDHGRTRKPHARPADGRST